MLLNPFRFGGAPPAGDPYFANVISLLHFDGADGATTVTDEKGVPWTMTGATLSTTHQLYGAASFFPAANGTLVSDVDASRAFGTGDFTIELAEWPIALGTDIIVDCRESADNDTKPVIYNVGNDLFYYVGGSNRISATSALGAGTFHRIALSRVSGVTRLFVDGAQVGSSWADSTNYDNRLFRISGNRLGSNNFINGWVDEWRVTKGVGRYASNYTPTGPFPNS